MSHESALALATGTPAPGLAAVPPPEAPKETAATEQSGLDSTRWAHLAKKESQLVRDREAFKKEREQFDPERKRVMEVAQKYKEFEELKAKDAVAAMRLAGFTDTDIFNFAAQSQEQATPEQRAEKAAQAVIDKHTKELAEAAAKEQKRVNEATLGQFRKQVANFVQADKEKYEYINHHGPVAEQLIEDTITEVLLDSNELMSVKEAADFIEEYYEEQDKLMSSLRKRQPKVEIPDAPVKEEPMRAEVSPRPTKTLSSKTVATTASAIPKVETRSQKRDRLIEKLRNGG